MCRMLQASLSLRFRLWGGATRLWISTTRTGSMRQMDEVRSGGSYLSQSDLRLHFGLGDAARINSVEVRWPNGATQTFEDVAADRFYRLKQGGVLTSSGH